VLSRDEVWAEDAAQQRGGVELPHALERKYPRAGSSWPWFWVFPQDHHSTDPRSGVVRRHHLYDQTFQRALVLKKSRSAVRSPLDALVSRHGGLWEAPGRAPRGVPT
jgi:hypothetical protein